MPSVYLRKRHSPSCDSSSDDVWLDRFEPEDGRSIEVVEPDQNYRETGLVDKFGNKIIAVEETDRIGFVRHGVKAT